MTSLESVLHSSLKVDETLVRFKSLMTLQYIDDQFPELSGMLQDSLWTAQVPPCSQCADRHRHMQEELQKFRSVLYLVNEDRICLRNHCLASKTPVDDFQEFVTKSQALHYELMKKVVEKERLEVERLNSRLKALGGEQPEISHKTVQTDNWIEIKGFTCSVSSIGADSQLQTPALLSPDDSGICSRDEFFYKEPEKPKDPKKDLKKKPQKTAVVRGRRKK